MYLERIPEAVEHVIGAQRVWRAPVEVHVVNDPLVARAQPAPLVAVVHEFDVRYEQTTESSVQLFTRYIILFFDYLHFIRIRTNLLIRVLSDDTDELITFWLVEPNTDWIEEWSNYDFI